MKKGFVFITLFLCGCETAPTETIYLQNASGDKVKCGPYTAQSINMVGDVVPHAEEMADHRLRQCVADYQIQGYQRVPSP